jgi:hypothetical protein
MTEPIAPTATGDLRTEVKHLLNRHSRENESNTPDHILADVMVSALVAFEAASKQREQWYGKALSINADDAPWVES